MRALTGRISRSGRPGRPSAGLTTVPILDIPFIAPSVVDSQRRPLHPQRRPAVTRLRSAFYVVNNRQITLPRDTTYDEVFFDGARIFLRCYSTQFRVDPVFHIGGDNQLVSSQVSKLVLLQEPASAHRVQRRDLKCDADRPATPRSSEAGLTTPF
jgi:hypothetical protein